MVDAKSGENTEKLRHLCNDVDTLEKKFDNISSNLSFKLDANSVEIARLHERITAIVDHNERTAIALKEEMVKQDKRSDDNLKDYAHAANILEKESNVFRVQLENRISAVEKHIAIIQAIKQDKADSGKINLGFVIAIVGWIVTIILFMIREFI